MKHIIPLLMIALAACKEPVIEQPPITQPVKEVHVTKEPPKEEYHIRVVPYGNWSYYVVHFTNDNWATYDELLTYCPLTKASNSLFRTFDEAVAVASKFDTYQKALTHNQRVLEKVRLEQESRPRKQIY